MSLLLLALLTTGAILTMLGFVLYVDKKEEEKILVHTETRLQYKVLSKCKIQSRTGWVSGFVYVSLNDGRVYVRRMQGFYNKLVTLKEWNKMRRSK